MDTQEAERRVRLTFCHLLPKTRSEVVVIGGLILDIGAAVEEGLGELQSGTSVPGRIRQVRGGVGANVAASLAAVESAVEQEEGLKGGRAAAKPLLVTGVGRDGPGLLLRQKWASEVGLSTRGITTFESDTTPTLVALFDAAGNLHASIADVGALERNLTSQVLVEYRWDLRDAAVVVLDANLSGAALAAAVRLSKEGRETMIWFEPVSVEKAKRLAFLTTAGHKVHLVSPNLAELNAMAWAVGGRGGAQTFLESRDFSSIEEALMTAFVPARLVLESGVGAIVLTLGDLGAAVLRLTEENDEKAPRGDDRKGGEGSGGSARDSFSIAALLVPALVVPKVANVNGAGDALAAGCISGMLDGLSWREALARGTAAASRAVQSADNCVTPECLKGMCSVSRTCADGAREIILSERRGSAGITVSTHRM